MNERRRSGDARRRPVGDFQSTIDGKAHRRIEARRHRDRSIWFGLGMFGLVGWTVAMPTVIGIAVGVWIDSKWPSRYSWTLMCMVIGMVVGCLTAWRWVKRESED